MAFWNSLVVVRMFLFAAFVLSGRKLDAAAYALITLR